MRALFGVCLLACAGTALAEDPKVVIRTSFGDVTVRLFAESAPVTVENFLAYVDSGFYKNTIFHRVIPNFMIQAGGFDKRMKEKRTRDPIVNEANNGLSNTAGTIAMARTSDPDSAASQFFINLRDNLNLDWTPSNPGYAVFGEVIDGMATVEAIAFQQTQSVKGHQAVPVEPILILEVTRVGE